MKLKDELKNVAKKELYDKYYARLTPMPKEYDEITRDKMYDEILYFYRDEDLYFELLCTRKEWKFLEYLKKHPRLTNKEKTNYKWEIEVLNAKLIFSKTDYKVYDEFKKTVDQGMTSYKGYPSSLYGALTYIIGLVKSRLMVPIEEYRHILKERCPDLVDSIEDFYNTFSSISLLKYYCSFCTFKKSQQRYIYYRDYEDMIDEFYNKKSGLSDMNPYIGEDDDYSHIFYYDFPINKSEVKKMYKAIEKHPHANKLFKAIAKSQIMMDDEYQKHIKDDKELIALIESARKVMPCAMLNGNPLGKSKKLKPSKKRTERDAYLSQSDQKDFYKIFFSLLKYVNDKKKIVKGLEMTEMFDDVNNKDWAEVADYVFDNRELIDEFIEENVYELSPKELEEVAAFKNAITSNLLFITSFEKDYMKVYDLSGKMYMVKEFAVCLKNVLKKSDLPYRFGTTLVEFRGNITYAIFLKNEEQDRDLIDMVKSDMKSAQECYKL